MSSKAFRPMVAVDRMQCILSRIEFLVEEGLVNGVVKACRLCGSTGPHKNISVRELMFGSRELFEYYSCVACDTLQIVDALEGDDLMRHYPSNYSSYDATAHPRFLRWLISQH